MIKFITGSMFTGKTTWLLEHQKKYYPKNSILYRPDIDTRELVTHKGIKYKAKSVGNISDLGEAFSDKIKAVYFDEIQFFEQVFGDLITFKEQVELIAKLKPVFCAGLDYNYLKQPFEMTRDIEEMADKVIRLKTYCSVCGKLAYTYSYRKVNDDNLVVIGGEQEYEPRCFNC